MKRRKSLNDFKFGTFICRFLCDDAASVEVKELMQCFGEKPLHKKECSRDFPIDSTRWQTMPTRTGGGN